MVIRDLKLQFIDNACTSGAKGKYVTMDVRIPAVLDSWRGSLFAFEWLNEDGSIKGLDDLALIQREKRLEVELMLNDRKPLEKPVLGMGLLDTVEIGSGKAILLTLGAHGIEKIPVHIPAADARDFAAFAV